MLTEKGFMQAKNGIPASVSPQVRNEPQMDKNTMPPQPQSSPSTIKQEPAAQKIQPITNATAPLQNDQRNLYRRSYYQQKIYIFNIDENLFIYWLKLSIG